MPKIINDIELDQDFKSGDLVVYCRSLLNPNSIVDSTKELKCFRIILILENVQHKDRKDTLLKLYSSSDTFTFTEFDIFNTCVKLKDFKKLMLKGKIETLLND